VKVTTVERDVLVAHSCRRLLVVRGPQTFGERLTARRLALGLTQQDVADLAGTSRNYLGQLERGVKQRVPNALTLAALARALRVGMDELWNGERQEMTA
jgi:transcriptional regulator with XRE-family HTH domain